MVVVVLEYQRISEELRCNSLSGKLEGSMFLLDARGEHEKLEGREGSSCCPFCSFHKIFSFTSEAEHMQRHTRE